MKGISDSLGDWVANMLKNHNLIQEFKGRYFVDRHDVIQEIVYEVQCLARNPPAGFGRVYVDCLDYEPSGKPRKVPRCRDLADCMTDHLAPSDFKPLFSSVQEPNLSAQVSPSDSETRKYLDKIKGEIPLGQASPL